MNSLWNPSACTLHRHWTHISSLFPSFPIALPSCFQKSSSIYVAPRTVSLKTRADGSNRSDLLRKPVNPPEKDEEVEMKDTDDEVWVDWEDQILEDTVPLVGFVRMILHSGKYEIGDKLSPEHERTIVERLLPYHPECEKKIGCGIDYITVGYHPDFETSRCLFIARKDGELVDFSYWKCIKGMIRKNYPLYADTFILRHFRRHGRS